MDVLEILCSCRVNVSSMFRSIRFFILAKKMPRCAVLFMFMSGGVRSKFRSIFFFVLAGFHFNFEWMFERIFSYFLKGTLDPNVIGKPRHPMMPEGGSK